MPIRITTPITRSLKLIFMVVILVGFSIESYASDNTYLYRAQLVQAAPGKLPELIDAYKYSILHMADGEEAPLWMRHSQGDHWDLFILWPMGNYAEFYKPERIVQRNKAEEKLTNKPDWQSLIATQEDVFVFGPNISEVRAAFAAARFYHVEMFQALESHHEDLLRERQMESNYQRKLKRPANLLFVRDQGAAWDMFTIGCYRDLKHYAESADIPEAAQEEAAKAVGFKSTSAIGPYLRQYIRSHHDTLAVAIK
jgi:hypothetical protein